MIAETKIQSDIECKDVVNDHEQAYADFAQKMASKVTLNNAGGNIDELMDALKKSEYYDKL